LSLLRPTPRHMHHLDTVRQLLGFLCWRTPCIEPAADRPETLAFDCIIQEQTGEFSVSCCLHWEHCVNSGMRHRSECRRHTTSHCCYCYCNSPNKRNLRQHQKNKHNENTIKKQATLVDVARKRGGLLCTGPVTTRARLPASRFARFLSPARCRRQYCIKVTQDHSKWRC